MTSYALTFYAVIIPCPASAAVKLTFRERSEQPNNLKVTRGYKLKCVSCNETQTSETKCTEVCWSNYPASEAKRETIPHQRWHVEKLVIANEQDR